MSTSVRPVARLAPSPTGRLHVGHAWSFLLAWCHARSRGGRVLLRLEDLDRQRVKPGMVEACLEDLAWLGLDWDDEPVLQSADARPYEAALARLVAADRVYPCVCTRREIEDAASAPQAGAPEARYPGTCRGRFASVAAAESATGRRAGLRFRVPPGAVRVEDELLGSHEHDVQRDVGDFLVLRRDGTWAYQLAVVVDDARQGVTEVLRGIDLLPSTPRQRLLQEALGLPRPTWLHVPLLVDDDGRRLAKRSGSRTLAALRAEGLAPAVLTAWLARAAGLEPGPRATARALLPGFHLDALPAGPVRFGEAERRELLRRSGSP